MHAFGRRIASPKDHGIEVGEQSDGDYVKTVIVTDSRTHANRAAS